MKLFWKILTGLLIYPALAALTGLVKFMTEGESFWMGFWQAIELFPIVVGLVAVLFVMDVIIIKVFTE